MRHSWVSTYDLSWSPPITFLNRALLLAERVESDFDPVSFVFHEDRIGFAARHRDVRISIALSGITIVLGPSTEAISDLEPELDLVLSVFEPTDLSLAAASDMIVLPVPGDYDEARSRLAGQASGLTHPVDGLTPTDTAVLIDLDDSDRHFQVEYGVVTADEAAERIAFPERSRSEIPHHGLPVNLVRRLLRGKLPDVGVLTYGRMRVKSPGTVGTVDQLIGQVEAVQDRFDLLAGTFTSRATLEGGDN